MMPEASRPVPDCPPVARAVTPGLRVHRAFTLVELLAVVAILAALVALLLPALRRAKGLATGVACGGNGRQLGIGMTLYAGDQEGNLPWFFNQADDRGSIASGTRCYSGMTWASLVYPYSGGLAVYRCPASEGGRPATAEHVPGITCVHHSNYKGNPYLGCNYGGIGPAGERADATTGGNFHYAAPFAGTCTRLHKVVMPGRKVLLFDASAYTSSPYGASIYGNQWQGGGCHTWTGAGPRYRNPPYANPYYSTWYGAPMIGTWHNLCSTFIFVDGHGALLPWTDPVSFNPDSADKPTIQANDDRYWKLYR